MLRGDLQTTRLPDLLRRLADAAATGSIYLLPSTGRPDDDEASVALRNGIICGVALPGAADSIGTRLVATRRLTPAALEEATQAQSAELATWPLAERLIHLGLADEQQVEDLITEQALSDLTALCSWRQGSWRFRRGDRGRPNLPRPLAVPEALAAVDEREAEWRALVPAIAGAHAVVSLAAHPDGDNESRPSQVQQESVELDADGFALLCAVDGLRTIGELGESGGFTLLDAGRTIARLVTAGLVQISPEAHAAVELPDETDKASTVTATPAQPPGKAQERSSIDAITAALSCDGPLAPAGVSDGFARGGAPWQPLRTSRGDVLAGALARVSAALSGAMTETVEQTPNVAVEPEPEPLPEPLPAPPAREQDAVEAARGAAQLLAQLARTPRNAPAPKPAPAAGAGVTPSSRRDDGLTDTAALLRELTSLGLDTNPPSSHPPTRPPISHNAAQHAKRRKGRFGRG